MSTADRARWEPPALEPLSPAVSAPSDGRVPVGGCSRGCGGDSDGRSPVDRGLPTPRSRTGGERHGVSGGSGLRGATRVRATGLAGRSGRFVGRRHERSHPSTDLGGLTPLGDAISTPSPLKCIYTSLSRNTRYFFYYRKAIPASLRTFDGYPRQTVRFRCRCLERPVPPSARGFESRISGPRSRRTFGSFYGSAFRLFRVPRARSGV